MRLLDSKQDNYPPRKAFFWKKCRFHTRPQQEGGVLNSFKTEFKIIIQTHFTVFIIFILILHTWYYTVIEIKNSECGKDW